jgi:clan AA aspartic protease
VRYNELGSRGGAEVGKVREKVKFTNLFDPTKAVEAEAVIDTGATMVVLPQDVVHQLGLRRIRETRVRYANNKTELKSVYGVVTVEIRGRTGDFDVLAEPEGASPLIGQVVLDVLDLVVDPRTRSLMPNPMSPEMPMVEILALTTWGTALWVPSE